MTLEGWLCPLCKGAHAPHVSTCPQTPAPANPVYPNPAVVPWIAPSNPGWAPNPVIKPDITWCRVPNGGIGQ